MATIKTKFLEGLSVTEPKIAALAIGPEKIQNEAILLRHFSGEAAWHEHRNEILAVTGENILEDLSYTPASSQIVQLILNAVPQDYGIDYSVAGKVVSWISPDFNLQVTDSVRVVYPSSG